MPRRIRAAVPAAVAVGSLLAAGSAVGLSPAPVIPVTSFSGATTPARLPRGRAVPIGLSAGFTSEDPAGGPAPELNRIEIELSRRISLRSAGRPLCRERLLYKTPEVAMEECGGSLIGGGGVISDIPTSASRERTVRLEGTMEAFYGLAEGEAMILARVETGEPMPLVYVIPFAIERLPSGRTSLVAHKMRIRHGRCARGHPNCFADPYGVNDLYSRVAGFELALGPTGGGRPSFLRAACPPGSAAGASFTLERIRLVYADSRAKAGGSADGACR